MLDPKTILEFIDIWCENPKTPLVDLKLPPGPKHTLTSYILTEKHRIEQTRQIRKGQYKKKRELKQKMFTITPAELLALQTEILQLEDQFNREVGHCFGAKDRLTAQVLKFIEEFNNRPPLVPPQNLQASSLAAPPEKTVVLEENARAEENIQHEEPKSAPVLLQPWFLKNQSSQLPLLLQILHE